ncbi:MAG: hypothetical protein HQ478_15495, partial [Chloroflexi bacterium]|nr:hypothetical protein [Chloroflexota bacterium]
MHSRQNNYDVVILDYLRGDGTTGEIPRTSYKIGLYSNTNYPSLGSGLFGGVDRRATNSFANAADFASWLSTIDVLYIPWIFDLGSAGSATLNSFAPEIEAFFNAGGDIVGESSYTTSTFYNFLPPGVAASGPSISGWSGFTATPEGVAIGIVSNMMNGFATHNKFAAQDPAFTVFEVRSGEVISIGVRDATISGGVISTGLSVTVNNVAPAVTAVGGVILENGTATVSGTITDPNTLDSFTLVINWGGSEGSTTVSLPAGTTSYSQTHQYLDDNPTGTASDIYAVSVTVTDDDSGVGIAGTTVTVNNVAPVVTVSGPASIDEGSSGTFSVSFTDVGTLDTHSVAWDCDGDGFDDGTGATTICGYADGPDSQTVQARVTDDDTGVGIGSLVVTINNVAPTATAVGDEIDEDGTATVTGTISDPGTLDSFTVVVNWGGSEGSSSVALSAGATSFIATHQYLDDNPTATASDVYPVSVTVTDNNGGVGTANTSVTVNNVAPIIESLDVTSPIDENSSATLTGTFTDPGTPDVHTLNINWGDGPTQTIVLTVGDRAFSVGHVYVDDDPSGTASDTYSVTVELSDDDGGVAGSTSGGSGGGGGGGGSIFLTGHDIQLHSRQNNYDIV